MNAEHSKFIANFELILNNAIIKHLESLADKYIRSPGFTSNYTLDSYTFIDRTEINDTYLGKYKYSYLCCLSNVNNDDGKHVQYIADKMEIRIDLFIYESDLIQ